MALVVVALEAEPVVPADLPGQVAAAAGAACPIPIPPGLRDTEALQRSSAACTSRFSGLAAGYLPRQRYKLTSAIPIFYPPRGRPNGRERYTPSGRCRGRGRSTPLQDAGAGCHHGRKAPG